MRAYLPLASLFVVSCLISCLTPCQAADAPANSSKLKWRPQGEARAVSVEKKSNITKTQLLGPLEGNPLRQPEPAVEEVPSLELTPGARPVLQPDPTERPSPFQPAPYQQMPQGSDQRREGRVPSLEEQLSQGPRRDVDRCPSPSDLKRITLIDVNLKPPSGDFPQYCPLADVPFQPRAWEQLTYTWKATALCHKPLYFEERALERYGHTMGCFQPFVSMASFYGRLPILPYEIGMHSPWECMYDLGYYEPGSCAPWLLQPIPLNLRGALFEAGAWVGGVYLIP